MNEFLFENDGIEDSKVNSIDCSNRVLARKNDSYRFLNNWEFVTDRATIAQRRLLSKKQGRSGAFAYKAI